jgi:hypothetical protein
MPLRLVGGLFSRRHRVVSRNLRRFAARTVVVAPPALAQLRAAAFRPRLDFFAAAIGAIQGSWSRSSRVPLAGSCRSCRGARRLRSAPSPNVVLLRRSRLIGRDIYIRESCSVCHSSSAPAARRRANGLAARSASSRTTGPFLGLEAHRADCCARRQRRGIACI